MSEYVKSSPHFFRLIKIAFAAMLAALLVGALFFPAPLQEPANVSQVPNPTKAAWFLMWTQELVSYSGNMVYLILVVAAVFLLLPWLPCSPPAERAIWLPRDQRPVNWLTLVCFVAIVALTVIGIYCRGENWSFVLPF